MKRYSSRPVKVGREMHVDVVPWVVVVGVVVDVDVDVLLWVVATGAVS